MTQPRTGSLILKAIRNPDAEERVTRYLQRYAKNIKSDNIPNLLRNLPVVLASNVAESTGRKVLAELRQLSAEVAFVPAIPQHKDTGHEEGDKSDPVETAAPMPSSEEVEVKAGGFYSLQELGFLPGFLRRNRELLIVLGMVAIAWMLNFTLASQYLLLGFYTLPPIMAAYYFGRRQAVLTAFASILLVVIVLLVNQDRFDAFGLAGMGGGNQWYHLVSWGAVLLITAYAMGTLYERYQEKIRELRRAYQAILLVLRHFVSLDGYGEEHCFRVSIYAAKIAGALKLSEETIEDIRSAALLHDISSLEINREVLHKASYLATGEQDNELSVVPPKDVTQQPMQGPLGRILPMLLLSHEVAADHNPSSDKTGISPIGAHILAVADRYDSLVNTTSFHEASSKQQAKEIIVKASGTDFHPKVVEAFVTAFAKGEMDIPDILL